MEFPSTFSFSLGVVSGELGQEPSEVVSEALRLGFQTIEVSSFRGKDLYALSREEVSLAACALEDAELPVVALSPNLFKAVEVPPSGSSLIDTADFQRHMENLRHTLELTRRFAGPEGHVPMVRVFSFRRPWMVGAGNPSPRPDSGGEIPERELDEVCDALSRAADLAREADVMLVLENVRSCWGNTGLNAGRILERVNSPWLGALWDPANDFVSGGRHFPDGWNAVKRFLKHIHVKDAAVVDAAEGRTSWECIGTGAVDFIAELTAWRDFPYEGAVHVETHWKPADGANGTEATTSALVRIARSLDGSGS